MATRKIVPRADNEGGIGTALKQWASGWIKLLTVTTINALSLAAAAVGFTIAGGTTSKTLTVSVDADTKDIIKGDGTGGRVLRQSRLTIVDGTGANTIKCTLSSLWNGDIVAVVDNIAKNATTGGYDLSTSGAVLTITDALIAGSVVAFLSAIITDTSNNEALTIYFNPSGGLRLNFLTLLAADKDITSYTGTWNINLLYLTSA